MKSGCKPLFPQKLPKASHISLEIPAKPDYL